MEKLRSQLRLPVDAFARSLSITPARLVAFEEQRASWPEETIRTALPKCSELLSVMQGDVEEAASLLAEISEG